MAINWYPGHMKKTRELIAANLKLVDAVVEVLDARIPMSSENPVIEELTSGKARVIALNKCDLADEGALNQWMEHFRSKGAHPVKINALSGEGMQALLNAIKTASAARLEKMEAQGRKNIALRIMIVGIPNCGKSSLINKLCGKNTAKVGNKPGVTRGKQWIRINKELELFDTPGILWPKIDDDMVGLNLACTGAIRDEVLNLDDIALYLLGRIRERYSPMLKERYDLEEVSEDNVKLLEDIGRRRGCLASGGDIDYEKVMKLLIDDFRKGRIGRINLEIPEDFTNDVESQNR